MNAVWQGREFSGVDQMNLWLRDHADEIEVRWITRSDMVGETHQTGQGHFMHYYDTRLTVIYREKNAKP